MVVLVKGYKPIIGNTEQVFVADSIHKVKRYISDNPPEAGGFVQYSIEEIEQVPEKHLFTCPHCNGAFNHPNSVVTLP